MRVKIRSEACKDPNRVGCGIATITVNGVDKSRRRRGYNIVVLNEKTGFCLYVLCHSTYLLLYIYIYFVSFLLRVALICSICSSV